MERYMDIFTKLAFVLLASWVVLAGLGMTDMPGSRHKRWANRPKTPIGTGGRGAVSVVNADYASDDLGFTQLSNM